MRLYIYLASVQSKLHFLSPHVDTRVSMQGAGLLTENNYGLKEIQTNSNPINNGPPALLPETHQSILRPVLTN